MFGLFKKKDPLQRVIDDVWDYSLAFSNAMNAGKELAYVIPSSLIRYAKDFKTNVINPIEQYQIDLSTKKRFKELGNQSLSLGQLIKTNMNNLIELAKRDDCYKEVLEVLEIKEDVLSNEVKKDPPIIELDQLLDVIVSGCAKHFCKRFKLLFKANKYDEVYFFYLAAALPILKEHHSFNENDVYHNIYLLYDGVKFMDVRSDSTIDYYKRIKSGVSAYSRFITDTLAEKGNQINLFKSFNFPPLPNEPRTISILSIVDSTYDDGVIYNSNALKIVKCLAPIFKQALGYVLNNRFYADEFSDYVTEYLQINADLS